MPDTYRGLLEFLEQLREEREELDVLIRGVEKRLGITNELTRDYSNSGSPKVIVSIESIPVGFFHNLSQAEAAEKLLRLNAGHPLTTPEIVNALRKSGMNLTSKNAMTIMYTTLKRNPKFERVANKAWGLSDWYKKKKREAETTTENTSNEINF